MSSQAAGLMAHPADRRSRSKRLTTILALGLVLIAALALPSASFAATDGDFSYVSDGTSVTITGCSASPCEANLTIPASIGGLPVTGIIDEAFYNQTSLRTVAIPASVTSLGVSAFNNSGLTSVSFEAGSALATIGDFAFLGTSGLTSINIPASVTTLGVGAFNNSGLTSVSFEAGSALATIGDSAFEGTSGLASITIPASVTSLGGSAFRYSGLTSVSFEAGSALATIGDFAFQGTSGLTSITIPASVTTIGDNAFGYSGLTSVIFLGDVPSVGSYAFFGVPNGAIAYVAPNYTGYGAVGDDFNGLTVASLLTYTSSGGNVTITGCAFDPCPLTAITIPASIGGEPVTAIGQSAFLNNTSLTSITLPDGLTTIGAYAFQYTSNLSSITIPTSVTSIGYFSFSSSGITSVSFDAGSHLTTIDTDAFLGASNLVSINLPPSLTTIGNELFWDCYSLESITIPSEITTIPQGTFHSNLALSSVTFAAGSKVNAVETDAFAGTQSLKSITLPYGVTRIERRAFISSGLESISLPSTVTSIGIDAFRGASSLTSITFPASLTSIGRYAFFYATSLSRVVFKGNAPTLEGTHVFDTVAAGAKAVLVGGVTNFGTDPTWNGLELQRAFQVDTGSSPVNRGTVVKATDLDLLNRPVFAWQRCSRLDDASSCSAITGSLGANGAWWGTRNADIGQQVRLKAIFDDSDWLTGLSGVVGPSNTTAPSLNQGLVGGGPKQGTALHTSFGTWDGYIAGTSTVAFQWQRCSTSDVNSCTTDIGTNSQWYRPVAADVGEYLRVTATLTTNGQTASAGTLVSGQVAGNLAGRRAHTAVRHKPSRHRHKTSKRSQHKRR